MLLQISHVAGSERGRSERLRGPRIRVGSDPQAELRLASGAGILPDHAEIVFKGSRFYLRPKGAVRINGQLVGEVALRDGDELEIGDDVHLRIGLVREDADRAFEFRAQLARAPAGSRAAGLRPARLLHGRTGAAVTLLFLAILVGGAYLASRAKPPATVAETLAHERTRQDHLRSVQEAEHEKRIRELRHELGNLEERMANRADVDARVGEVQAAMAEIESSVLERVDSEIAASIDQRPELQEARDALRRIAAQDAAAERIIRRYAGAVCLVQGSYGFGVSRGGEWRFLREAPPELMEDPDSDSVPLSLKGDGAVFQVEYTGTAFLVDSAGIVLTNRHIAEPWWHNRAAEPLIKQGFKPRFIHLRAYFPGRKKPYDFDLGRTLVSKTTDLAALRFTPRGRLPLPFPLADPKTVVAGRRVLLLGYPSGLDALIARTEEKLARNLSDAGEIDPLAVLDTLAERGLVRPLPTQGHLSDVLPDKVLFDAPTAVGGSGGPLVDMEGRVVAINYGILKAFSGANFGVPVSHALPLLERARATPK